MADKFYFAIDRGGTFTDVLALCPNNKIRALKLLSEDPARYADAPREGIRRILVEETDNALTADGLVETERIGWVQMGTTVATNALLERAGEPVALIVNRGFRDLLHIGNQARPKIFDLNIRRPANLYKRVVEIDGRLVPAQRDRCQLVHKWATIRGCSDTEYYEMQPLDETTLRSDLVQLLADGISSIAVVLAHSYACPRHELRVGQLAAELGFANVTLSHQAMPMCRMVGRGYTACAEAYLTPHVERYLHSFRQGFKDELRGVDVLFMQSDGGLTRMETFRGARAILSGPAGGVVGYALTGRQETDLPLIGFDMGGTSTDVSRYADKFEHVVETTTAGITIQAPQLDINTVAAGGGSRLFFRSGLFVVGPESAGSHPGPACYRKGGPLTVTDANLILGRLQPKYFPSIFGPSETEPLDYEASRQLFVELSETINAHLLGSGERKVALSIEEIALGFVRVANETMCRPIRALTQSRGYDTGRHALACFGGAGGQHACSIARDLGMSRVLVHKYAGILSAYGMALADVVQDEQRPCGLAYEPANGATLTAQLTDLQALTRQRLLDQAVAADRIECELFLHMRYEGTDGALMCVASPYTAADAQVKTLEVTSFGDFQSSFLERYRSEYGFVMPGRRILVDDIRCRASGKRFVPTEPAIAKAVGPPVAEERVPVFFDHAASAWPVDTPIYLRTKQGGGHSIVGPAIIIDQLCTIIVEPDCTAEITARGDLTITIGTSSKANRVVDERLDAVQLSIFSHRFMSIAEQMGRILQRTSISTNIKERLDFSCALFGPDGGLVSNAPHIPVHLGSMQEAVQYQLRLRGDTLRAGDVLLTNHPQAGGSHLPDLTVITPVFHKNCPKPVFFVAARGHHADIGGITPGSMPPHSTSLAEEGAAFMSFLLVKDGEFQEDAVSQHLRSIEGAAAGASGTRNLGDNLSDLRAQVAANHKGIQLVAELIDAYGLSVVQAYMGHIQQNAELAVREMLKEIARNATKGTGDCVLRAEQFMDDGSPIRLCVTIDSRTGSALCDFTGTGCEVWGNCNAPRAITLSALIYCLRCMVGHDVPLNQGCLAPIRVLIPSHSILDPSADAAVVGGNVQTSQRIVDTVLQAFGVCAASQGCMNNVTIGDEHWGYYETVAGGSGAGPGWHGVGGVHTHMTNTRITDPEILELRYPMILTRFSLRDDESGGRGQFCGGEGVQRELLFRRSVTVSVLTERRALQPYGMAGGEPAKRGENYLIRRANNNETTLNGGGRRIRLAGKTAVAMQPGDRFSMLTPGGGGYGRMDDDGDRGKSGADVGLAKHLCVDAAATAEDGKFVERGSVFEYKQLQESV